MVWNNVAWKLVRRSVSRFRNVSESESLGNSRKLLKISSWKFDENYVFILETRDSVLVFVHNNVRLLCRRSLAYKDGPNHMWDVRGDQFDSMYEINLGKLEWFEDLSLDKPKVEAVVFDVANEDEVKDDIYS